jgi:predicted peroxiredoxin
MTKNELITWEANDLHPLLQPIIRKESDMTRRFRKSVFLTLLLLSFTALSSWAQAPRANKVRDGVFVHISHGADNPHRLLMALKMAVTMVEGGKDVVVYCDIEAVKVLTHDAQVITFEEFPSSHEALDRLKELKVPVLACPTCMKVARIEPDALRPGVSVAQKDRFFRFTTGRILSIDY